MESGRHVVGFVRELWSIRLNRYKTRPLPTRETSRSDDRVNGASTQGISQARGKIPSILRFARRIQVSGVRVERSRLGRIRVTSPGRGKGSFHRLREKDDHLGS